MTEAPNEARLPWIDPVVDDLDVASTAAMSRRGGDGAVYGDCTRS